MNSKHLKTYEAIHRDPVSGTIEWKAVEKLLLSLGCEIVEGSGSRVRFVKDGLILSVHRPHPAKEAKRYQIKEVRDYLAKLGIEP